MSRNQKSPLIPKVRKEDKERVLINVPADVGADARLYAEYLNGDLSYVFTEALRYTVRRDGAFREWRKSSKLRTPSPAADVPVMPVPSEKTTTPGEPSVVAQPEPTVLPRKPRIA